MSGSLLGEFKNLLEGLGNLGGSLFDISHVSVDVARFSSNSVESEVNLLEGVNLLLVKLSLGWSWFLVLSEDSLGSSDSSSDHGDSSVDLLSELDSLGNSLGDSLSEWLDLLVDSSGLSPSSSADEDLLLEDSGWLLLVDLSVLGQSLLLGSDVLLTLEDNLGSDDLVSEDLLVLW